MDDFIEGLPKAELHVHLEGTVEPELLWSLAERYRSPLVHEGRQALDRLYATGKFSDFLLAFKTICQHLRTPEDYEAAAYGALRQLALQNVRYVEFTLSAGVIHWKGEELQPLFEGALEGCRRGWESFGIRSAWIFDAVRQFGEEKAVLVVREAAKLRDRGVIAFGIGGDENAGPPEMFTRVFGLARNEGLRTTAHAGETAGPQSIKSTIDLLKPDRIGHGFSAYQDSSLVDLLAARQIPLEICMTSNYKTGCLAKSQIHPVRQYWEKGILFSLNSDDPALFGTTLNGEYRRAAEDFGFSNRELCALAVNSFRTSFLSESEKKIFIDEAEAFAAQGS